MRYTLVARELTRIARSKAFYTWRTVLAVWILISLATAWLSYFAGARFGAFEAEYIRRILEHSVVYVQYTTVCLIAPVLTSAAVAREKEQRSLPFLVLADCSGAGIYFAKYLTALVQCQLILLTSAPILAILAFLGGIDIPFMLLRLAIAGAYLCGVCALGMLFSTLASRPVRALMATMVAIVVWLLADLALSRVSGTDIGWSVLSYRLGRSTPPSMATTNALMSFAEVVLIVAFAASLAIRKLPSQALAVERPAKGRKRDAPSRAAKRPVTQLVKAISGGFAFSLRSRRARVLAAIGLAVGLNLLSVPYIVVGLLAFEIAATMDTARRTGMLDEILATPGTDREIAVAIVKAFRSLGRIYLPAYVLSHVPLSLLLFSPGALVQTSMLAQFVLPMVLSVVVFFVVIAVACYASTLRVSPVTQTILTIAFFWAFRTLWYPLLLLTGALGLLNMLGSWLMPYMVSWLVLQFLPQVAFGVWCHRRFCKRLRQAPARRRSFFPTAPAAQEA